MRRQMERDNARAERIERGALAALEMMAEGDKKRFRIEPNSDYILKLEAAYKQAKRDLKLRLPGPSWRTTIDDESNILGVWDLIFELAWLAPTQQDAKAWATMMLYSQTLRARGKGMKTIPEVKALLDHLTECRLLCYDKKTRTYRTAQRYEPAMDFMRELEMHMLNRLLRDRPPIRER